MPLKTCENKIAAWSSFPLFVDIRHSDAFDIERWVRLGIVMWEDDTLLNLFSVYYVPDAPKVVIEELDEVSSNLIRGDVGSKAVAAAYVGSDEWCMFTDAHVYLLSGFRDIADDQKATVVQHELGHVLGLGHDAEHSLMAASRRSACRASLGHVVFVQSNYDSVTGP